MATLLVIDDEPNNIKLITLELEDAGHTIIAAEDGNSGWQQLCKYKDKIDLILLDRMMPRMNGIEFMQKIKQHYEFQNIPVIMQTAAAEKDQIAEGINAGVYYYLTKPYEEEVMLSIVNAALAEAQLQKKLNLALKQHEKCFGLTTYSEWEFKTLDECEDMASFIASYFPEPERVVKGLSELFINALEHGNLLISYDDKTKLNNADIWRNEIEKRSQLPDNKDKKIKVIYKKHEKNVELTIQDQGTGFNWEQYLEFNPNRITDNHGRGIALAKKLCFDELQYQGCGNEVVCRVNF